MRGTHRWAAALLLLATAGSSRAGEDWDLYMLRLVNRARLDPAGEAARIGSSVTDSTPSRPPLAYNLQVETAATHHNNWMHDNFATKLVKKDGSELVCATCHGTPMNKHFLEGWAAAATE